MHTGMHLSASPPPVKKSILFTYNQIELSSSLLLIDHYQCFNITITVLINKWVKTGAWIVNPRTGFTNP